MVISLLTFHVQVSGVALLLVYWLIIAAILVLFFKQRLQTRTGCQTLALRLKNSLKHAQTTRVRVVRRHPGKTRHEVCDFVGNLVFDSLPSFDIVSKFSYFLI